MAVIKSSLLATAFSSCSGLISRNPSLRRSDDPDPPPDHKDTIAIAAHNPRSTASFRLCCSASHRFGDSDDRHLGRLQFESMDDLQLLHARTKSIFDAAAIRSRGSSHEQLFTFAAAAADSSPDSPHPLSPHPISSDFQYPARTHPPADPEFHPAQPHRPRYSRSADSGLPDYARIRVPTAIGRFIGAFIHSPRSHRNRHRRRNNQSLSETDRAQRLHQILVAVQEQLSVVSTAGSTNPPMIAQNHNQEDIDASNLAIDKHPRPLDPHTDSVHSMAAAADGNVQNHIEPANRTGNSANDLEAHENNSVCGKDQVDPTILSDDNQVANHDLVLDEHRQAELEELFLSYLRLSSPDPSTALTFLHALNPHLITSMNRRP